MYWRTYVFTIDDWWMRTVTVAHGKGRHRKQPYSNLYVEGTTPIVGMYTRKELAALLQRCRYDPIAEVEVRVMR